MTESAQELPQELKDRVLATLARSSLNERVLGNTEIKSVALALLQEVRG